uniref:Uncharacterized protein n=1 Tax=Arundo donax TaxID=35708 RepID=A0A0A9CT43_ARUDO
MLEEAAHKTAVDQLQVHQEGTWACEGQLLEPLQQGAFVKTVPASKRSLGDKFQSNTGITIKHNEYGDYKPNIRLNSIKAMAGTNSPNDQEQG